jgi:hypothetical protein
MNYSKYKTREFVWRSILKYTSATVDLFPTKSQHPDGWRLSVRFQASEWLGVLSFCHLKLSPIFKRHFVCLPLRTAPIFDCVISSTAAESNLLKLHAVLSPYSLQCFRSHRSRKFVLERDPKLAMFNTVETWPVSRIQRCSFSQK